MAAIDPLASGLLSLLAAGVASIGAVYSRIQQQQAEREKREREQLEGRVKALEDKNHQQDLALTSVQSDLRHLREAVDDMRTLLRQVLGLAPRPSNPSLPGAE